MSAKNRGTKTIANDAYPTPPWCVRRLLEAVELDLVSGYWLEPACGEGAIVDAVDSVDLHWSQVDIRAGTDYLTWQPGGKFDVAITNPPFSLAFEFARKMVREADRVFLLTRLNILEAGKKSGRLAWLRQNTPDVYVLPDRPCFSHSITCLGCSYSYPLAWNASSPSAPCGQLSANEWSTCGSTRYTRKAGTDATGYCWLHWDSSTLPRSSGLITHLAETPAAERVDRVIP